MPLHLDFVPKNIDDLVRCHGEYVSAEIRRREETGTTFGKNTKENVKNGKLHEAKITINPKLCGTWKANNAELAVSSTKYRSCIETEEVLKGFLLQ